MRFRRFSICIVFVFLLVGVFITKTDVNAGNSIKLNKKSVSLETDDSITLKVTGTKKKIVWSSTNKKVATVKSKGKNKAIVTAKKEGKCTIKAKVGKKIYKCKVSVVDYDEEDDEEDDEEEVSDNQNEINKTELYSNSYDIIVSYVKEKGMLQRDAKTFFKGYATLDGAYTDIDGSYLELTYASGDTSIILTRGSQQAKIRSAYLTNPRFYMVANVDISTIKGDGTDTFDWKIEHDGTVPAEVLVNSCNAKVVNMLKSVNGSINIKTVKLRNLGFTNYAY